MSGKAAAAAILSPKGSVIGTPSSSSKEKEEVDEEMVDAPEPTVVDLKETLRVKLPDTFSGNRKDLEVFLLQVELYTHFNEDKFPTDESYGLWTSSYLRGEAMRWVEPFLKDYFQYEETCGRMATTRSMFGTWAGFKHEIRRMFGDIDEVKTAENHLYGLRQTSSAVSYATEFQKYASRTGWDASALSSHYKRGLKDFVRLELARMDPQPRDLIALIEQTVRIDNRLYEFQRERRTQAASTIRRVGYQMNERRRRIEPARENRWSDPMELDAIQFKKKPSQEEMDRRRKDKLCFECGLPGHMANSHRKGKPGNGKKGFKKQLNSMGRGGYNLPIRELRVMDRFDTDEMEKLGIYTQTDPLDEEIRNFESMSLSTEGGDDEPTIVVTPPDDKTPRVGEIWTVVQQHEFVEQGDAQREWQNTVTQDNHREHSAPLDGPRWGEDYLVVYRDSKHIGWLGEGRAEGKSYLERLPQPRIHYAGSGTEPQEGEVWKLQCQSTEERMWERVEEEAFYWEDIQPGSSRSFETGNLYRVVNMDDDHRGWSNVVTGQSHMELYVMGYDAQISCDITFMGKKLRAMIDSGATGNFIDPKEVIRHGIRTEVKKQGYQLVLADGKVAEYRHGEIDTETVRSKMVTDGTHMEMIRLDVFPLGRHQVILGMPWIRKHNPTIDWKNGTITFNRCECITARNTHKKVEELDDTHREACATSEEAIGHQAQDPLVNQLALVQQVDGQEVNKRYHPDSKDYAERYRQEFEKLFSNEQGIEALPEHQPWDHEIPLVEGGTPPFRPIIPLPESKLKALKEYLDDALKKGFIRESTSPAGAPIFFVPKKDGPDRPVVDYRGLNNVTIKDRYALPLAGELRDRLQGAKIFTQLDLRGAYNLIRIKEGEEWKTAFRTRYGHYEYLVMSYGLTNAPATCQRLMNNILRPFLDNKCICYLDDILVYSSNPEEHEKDVRDVLSALDMAKLKLKPEKCRYHTKEVTFLGYVITTQGIKMDPSKVSSILTWSSPTTVKETQSFLGFANFYRRFIKDYSKIAAPITALTRKDQEFKWTEEARDAFNKLKQAFTTAPLLATFDPEKEIRVETDSSDYALGAVLSQPNEQGR